MISLLLAVIYLAFISLGLPDSLLGSAWPTMQIYFDVPSSYAGFVSMTIALMTIISSLFTSKLVYKLTTKWVVIISIFLTIIGMFGFSLSTHFWMLFIFALPYGLGAGAIDASLNSFVANHYSARVMNFLHCFYGVGSIISPNIMGLALRYGHFHDGYKAVGFIQIGIVLICIMSLPLWKKVEKKDSEESEIRNVSIKEALKIPGVIFALIGFFAYSAGEATCFLWTSSFFDKTKIYHQK